MVGVLLLMSRDTSSTINPIAVGLFVCNVLVGSSSFVFHANPRIGTYPHTLDVFTSWYLYLYLALLTPSALLYRHIHVRRKLFMFFVFTLHFVSTTTIVFLNEIIHANQTIYYVLCGSIVYVCVGLMRLRFHHGRVMPHPRCTASVVVRAAADVALLLGLQAAYVVLQGELWHIAVSTERRNIEHGYWHVGNGLIATVVALYALQDMNTEEIGRAQWSEVVVKGTFVSFHILLLSLTDVDMPFETYCGVVVGAQVLLCAVSTVSLAMHVCRQRTHVTPTPFV